MKNVVAFTTLLFYFVFCCTDSCFAQGKNPVMKEFKFTGSTDNDKKRWGTKKLPVTGEALYTSTDNWKWRGSFIDGHLHGIFTLTDNAGALVFEGEARMDTVISGTQYKMTKWGKPVQIGTGVGLIPYDLLLPVFSGVIKNNKWHSGRTFQYEDDRHKGPYLNRYIDAVYNAEGYPSENIYTYEIRDLYNDSSYFLAKYQEKTNSIIHQYRKDGSLMKTYFKATSGYTYKETYFPHPDNAEGIAYMLAPGSDHDNRSVLGVFYEYANGEKSHLIKGWLHTQYKDGHCTKTLYDTEGKPIPGIEWNLPASSTGIRPDSLNFNYLVWNNKDYKGGVLNGKPNGWGKYRISDNITIEGYFKDGVQIGYAAATNDGRGNRYFAVHKDGNISPNHTLFDATAIAAEQNKLKEQQRLLDAERERLSRPAPLPGPKRVIAYSVAEGYVQWSDYTLSYGENIRVSQVQPGMIMMYKNKLQVVQIAPTLTNRIIVFMGLGKESTYTVSPNTETVRIYPELQSIKASLLGPCSICFGSGKSTTVLRNKEGKVSMAYVGTKQIQHNFYNVYEPLTASGFCFSCQGTGVMQKQ